MKLKRTAALISGALIYLFIGLIYAWSIFVAPLEAEFGWTRTETSATFTVSMTCFCLGGILSGIISKRKSARFILALAAILLLIGFISASRVETVVGLYIAYGVFCGFGVGLAYNADISTVTKWFPDKMGSISGILLMCFGFGGMLLGSVASALIIAVGWRTTFTVFGVAFALLLLICSVWIVPPKENMTLPVGVQKSVAIKDQGLSLTVKDMIRRKSFWLQFLWAVILSAAGLAVIGHASVCAQDLGATVTMATIITGTISISNGAGRILAGLIFDSLGRKVCIGLDNLVMVIAFIVLVFAVHSSSIPILFAGGILLGLAYGSLPPTNSAYVNLFYGSENYALNFSIMNSNIIPASFLGPLVSGVIKTETGSYLIVFLLLLVLSVFSYVLQLGIKKP